MLKYALSIVTLLKEVKALLAFFGVTSISLYFERGHLLDYIYLYNIHLVLLVAVFLFVFCYFIIWVKKEIGTLKQSVEDLIRKGQSDEIRREVKLMCKDLHNIEEITFRYTVRHIIHLEKRRRELKLNDYTEAGLKELLAKIPTHLKEDL